MKMSTWAGEYLMGRAIYIYCIRGTTASEMVLIKCLSPYLDNHSMHGTLVQLGTYVSSCVLRRSDIMGSDVRRRQLTYVCVNLDPLSSMLYVYMSLSGYLAQFAHQIFDGLVAQAKVHESRLEVLRARTNVLIAALKEKRATAALIDATTESLIPETISSGFFTRETLPFAIHQRYISSAVGTMPDFSGVEAVLKQNDDKSNDGDGARDPSSWTKNYSYPGNVQPCCLLQFPASHQVIKRWMVSYIRYRKYILFLYTFNHILSNIWTHESDFFVHEWMRAEEERIMKLQEERKLRRAEKRARKQQLQGKKRRT